MSVSSLLSLSTLEFEELICTYITYVETWDGGNDPALEEDSHFLTEPYHM